MKRILSLLLLAALPLAAQNQQKASDRPVLTGAEADLTNDIFEVVDTSATTSKQMTFIEYWKALGGTNVSPTELGYLDGVTGAIQPQINAKEAALGNPGTNGHVLSSTTGGTRSWIAPGGTWGSITGTLASQTDVTAALDARETRAIGFYDDFSRADRYPDGTELYDAVTMPLYGTAWKFKANDGNQPVNARPFVLNGSLQNKKYGQGYLAAHAFTQDARNWSAGFKFVREQVFGSDPRHNFTITLGKAPLVITTHNAWGKVHVNMDMMNITSTGGLAFGANWSVTVNHTLDELTLGAYVSSSPELSLLTGDAVGVAGSPVPTGLSASSTYYAIRSGSIVKLATTKALALAGTADALFSSSGTSVTLSRALVCTNRKLTASGFPWADPQLHSRQFQGSTVGNVLTTTNAVPFAVGDAVMLEGTDLPEPLVTGQPYYVATKPTQYSVTLSATLGGSAITLTDNGAANQIIRGKAYPEAGQFMPYGTQSMVIATRTDDIIEFTLVGVGTIKFYARNLDEVLGAQGEEMGFYWQTPPTAASGTPDVTYPSYYSLISAWIDAPIIQRRELQLFTANLSRLMASNTARLNGKLELIPQNASRDTTADTGLNAIDYGLLVDSGSQTATATATKFRRQRRYVVAGGLAVFPGHTDNTALSMAELTIKDSLTATASYNFSDSAFRSISGVTTEIQSVWNPGDTETWEFGGTLTGAAFKGLQMYTSYGTLVLDHADLTAVSGNFTIHVTRKLLSGASNNEVWFSTLQVGATLYAPKRTVVTFPATPGNYYLALNAGSATANTITVDYVRHTLSLFPGP